MPHPPGIPPVLSRRHALALLGAAAGAGLSSCLGAAPETGRAPAGPPVSGRWRVVFGDDFSGNRLDRHKWRPNYPWGRAHNHRAFMDPAHLRVHDGHLIIRGVRGRHPDAPATARSGGKTYSLDYQAAAIHTADTFRFQYGYVEACMKMPHGTGFWPAFWMLCNGWPPEIDIMEFLSSHANRYHVALHYGYTWRNHRSHGHWIEGLPDLSAGFHTYGLHWTRERLDFYFDRRRVRSVTDRAAIAQMGRAYLLINLAIGGWERDPNDSTVFERNWFETSWVRVWQTE